MTRLIIVCEGETEQQFCNQLLMPYFLNKNITISSPLIKKSNGGICAWSTIKKQVLGHIHEGAIVTTFFDYYGIKESLNFPCWKESKAIEDKIQRMDFLERAMLQDVETSLQSSFIPYLQLHEFESLLFCNVEAFEKVIPQEDLINKKSLIKILHDYQNPELINEGISTSPSHRMEKIIAGYIKPLYGADLADAIGLKIIREKCPHFNQWIRKLETLGK